MITRYRWREADRTLGRTLGVRAATTPYVAFSDDDSWWEPGALQSAADLRNALWFAWTRRSPAAAGRVTAALLRAAPKDRATARAVAEALRG
jgi:hypothetical protein